jgi:fucose permease
VVAPLAVAGLGSAFLWTLAAGTVGMAAVVASGPRDRAAVRRETSGIGIEVLTVVAAALLLLYSGTESALGGWLSTYARRMPETGGLWAVLPSIFWSGILLGRVAAPSMLASLSAPRLVMLGMIGALLGTTALVIGHGPVAIAGATLVAGLSMAPIFPLVVAQYADRAGGGAASGLLFAASGLGGSVIPPLVGVVAGASGSLRVGLAALVVAIAGMVGLEWRLRR